MYIVKDALQKIPKVKLLDVFHLKVFPKKKKYENFIHFSYTLSHISEKSDVVFTRNLIKYSTGGPLDRRILVLVKTCKSGKSHMKNYIEGSRINIVHITQNCISCMYYMKFV